jgi:hypothetical protein
MEAKRPREQRLRMFGWFDRATGQWVAADHIDDVGRFLDQIRRQERWAGDWEKG